MLTLFSRCPSVMQVTCYGLQINFPRICFREARDPSVLFPLSFHFASIAFNVHLVTMGSVINVRDLNQQQHNYKYMGVAKRVPYAESDSQKGAVSQYCHTAPFQPSRIGIWHPSGHQWHHAPINARIVMIAKRMPYAHTVMWHLLGHQEFAYGTPKLVNNNK